MEPNQITESKKRNIVDMTSNELSSKLKSKQDFVAYLDQHRKWNFISIRSIIDMRDVVIPVMISCLPKLWLILTCLSTFEQCSTIFQARAPLPRTSSATCSQGRSTC